MTKGIGWELPCCVLAFSRENRFRSLRDLRFCDFQCGWQFETLPVRLT